MQLFFTLFNVNIQRALFSIWFLISALCVSLTIFLASFGLYHSDADVLNLLQTGISGSGSVNVIIGILPVLAFATSFASEWQQKATSFWLIRTGIWNYSLNKVIVSALSGFFITAVGIVVFILIMLFFLPLSTDMTTGDPYMHLLEANQSIRYLLFYIIHISLGSALFAVAGLWVSTFIPNKFVTVSVPMVLYFVAHRFTTQLEIPTYFKAVWIVEAMYDAGSPMKTLFLKLGIVIGLCTLMGFGVVSQIKRRIQHD